MHVGLLVVPFLFAAIDLAPPTTEPRRPLQGALQAEMGFLAPLAHTLQLSRDGSTLDYVREGGQDVLFAFSRFQAELTAVERHTLVFLYQPLQLDTRVVPTRDLSIDGGLFAANAALDLRYGFQFWRASYLYALPRWGKFSLGLGGSLQVRDAVLDFSAPASALLRSSRNVGPVPLLKARAQLDLPAQLWLGVEVDGIYAPVKYLNGGRSDVVGALLDASLRLGAHVGPHARAFVNLRYLGGGAEGTSSGPRDFGDGFSRNWLHFFTLSVGADLR